MRPSEWIGIAAVALMPLTVSDALASETVISPERQQALRHLLKQDCGSCHGMTMKGGLGPSLLPQELSTKDVSALTQKILVGVPEKGMPSWQPLLTDAEAGWLAEQLVKGVPDLPGEESK